MSCWLCSLRAHKLSIALSILTPSIFELFSRSSTTCVSPQAPLPLLTDTVDHQPVEAQKSICAPIHAPTTRYSSPDTVTKASQRRKMQVQSRPPLYSRSFSSSRPSLRRTVLVAASKTQSRTDKLRELLKGPTIIKVGCSSSWGPCMNMHACELCGTAASRISNELQWELMACKLYDATQQRRLRLLFEWVGHRPSVLLCQHILTAACLCLMSCAGSLLS